MIRVVKPAAAPAVLLNQGAKATQELCEAFDSGVPLPEFKSSIYAHISVKDALRTAQHEKCAFCESVFSHVGFGDVEHFRPKAGYKQRDSDKLKQPGYFWLAYAWVNLFYCCQLCNQRFKRNHFPLKDGRRRTRPHTRNIDREEPLLIDPSKLDPTDHIGFRGECAFAVNGSREGEKTIEVLGLNREELVTIRRDWLAKFKLLVQSRDRLRDQVSTDASKEEIAELHELESFIETNRAASGHYSAMVHMYLDRIR